MFWQNAVHNPGLMHWSSVNGLLSLHCAFEVHVIGQDVSHWQEVQISPGLQPVSPSQVSGDSIVPFPHVGVEGVPPPCIIPGGVISNSPSFFSFIKSLKTSAVFPVST